MFTSTLFTIVSLALAVSGMPLVAPTVSGLDTPSLGDARKLTAINIDTGDIGSRSFAREESFSEDVNDAFAHLISLIEPAIDTVDSRELNSRDETTSPVTKIVSASVSGDAVTCALVFTQCTSGLKSSGLTSADDLKSLSDDVATQCAAAAICFDGSITDFATAVVDDLAVVGIVIGSVTDVVDSLVVVILAVVDLALPTVGSVTGVVTKDAFFAVFSAGLVVAGVQSSVTSLVAGLWTTVTGICVAQTLTRDVLEQYVHAAISVKVAVLGC